MRTKKITPTWRWMASKACLKNHGLQTCSPRCVLVFAYEHEAQIAQPGASLQPSSDPQCQNQGSHQGKDRLKGDGQGASREGMKKCTHVKAERGSESQKCCSFSHRKPLSALVSKACSLEKLLSRTDPPSPCGWQYLAMEVTFHSSKCRISDPTSGIRQPKGQQTALLE